jgi:DNA invertase Pin-like site-specific DNA recombinase
MNAVVYIRALKNSPYMKASLALQADECRRFCSRQGLEIVAVFTDEHRRADKGRAAFAEMMGFCRKHRDHINRVVAFCPDMISNDADTCAAIKDQLAAMGITLLYTEEPVATDHANRSEAK